VAQPVNTRDSPRINVDAFVKIAGAEREFVFRTRDLSKSGLFLYTRVGHMYPFKVGSTLSIELYDFDQYVTLSVVVVRVVAEGTDEAKQWPTGFGVKIVEMREEDRGRFEAILERSGGKK
jgi:hypothetical protein